jgi:hypothetical protein
MNPLNVFKIKPEERLQAVVALLVIILLNGLFIYRMHDLFMQEGFGPYWKVFEREVHLSGYDPLTYLSVTEWDVLFNVYRHPLLAFMVWPLSLLNAALSSLFGINFVQYIVAVPLILASFYSYIWMYRIQREVISLERVDATLLTAFFFSLAYIMLSVFVPDHFTISMFLVLLTLYISGVCIRKGREFLWWQSALLFLMTAGITLSNGVKVFLSGFFVNRRDFFRLKYLLMAVIIPTALLWGFAHWENLTFKVPREQAYQQEQVRKAEQEKQKVAAMTPEQREKYEKKKAKRELVLQRQAAKTGKPMEDHGFLKWTDITTSRLTTVYENLFGESMQFHQDYFLEDTLVHRPVFVPYRWTLSYVVEAAILLLVAFGIWCGRRNRFLWLCLCCFGFDMFIHLLLGFGINEVFIMSPHFLFVLPVCIGYLAKAVGSRIWLFRTCLLALTLWLLAYNGWLLVDFLLTPIRATL